MTRWTLIRWIFVLALCAVLCAAPATAQNQETSKAAETQVHRVIHLKHIGTAEAFRVLSPLSDILTSVSPVRELSLVSLRGTESAIGEAERLLAEVDVPRTPKATTPSTNVMLTGYFVGASASSAAAVPQQLEEVVTELRRYFPYENYELLETFGVRTQLGGEAALTGLMSTDPDLPATRYSVEFDVGGVADQGTRKVITIESLNVEWRMPVQTASGQFIFETPSLTASLDIPEGVTVVVGKSGTVGSHSGIFLLLRAEVVDP